MDEKTRQELDRIMAGGHERALAELYAEYFSPAEIINLAWLNYKFVRDDDCEKESDFIFLESVKRAVRKAFEMLNKGGNRDVAVGERYGDQDTG